jgi:MFS family permease
MAFVSQAAILPLFVAHYTSTQWIIGLIPAIFMLGLQGPQVLGAAYRSRLASFWGAFKTQILLPRLALFAMALTPLLPGDAALAGFFLCFCAFSVTLGFQVPSWFEYVSYLVPPDRRGRFFGYRHALGGVGSMAAAGLAALLLDRVVHPWNFVACFALAAVALMVAYLLMLAVRFDWSSVDRQRNHTAPFWDSGLAMIRANRDFRAFVILRAVLAGGTMAMAFYVVHAKTRFGMSSASSSLLAIALMYVPALTGIWWGRMADSIGNRRAMMLGVLLAALSSAVLAAGPSLPVYVLGLVGVGSGQIMLFVLDGKWLLQIDEAHQGAVISFFSLAMLPASVGLPVLAGVFASGLGMPALFAATAAAWLLGAALLAGYVREPSRGSRIPEMRSDDDGGRMVRDGRAR